jgi:hypothetical protein
MCGFTARMQPYCLLFVFRRPVGVEAQPEGDVIEGLEVFD